jgi:integrase
MASIRKRGDTYHITVSLGVDKNYKQVRKFTTFTPPHGLTEKQGKKAAQEYARTFELNCKGLTAYDENMTLVELCNWYFTNIAPNRTRERTIEGNQFRLNSYVLPKLGQKKLKELKPAMLAAHFTEIQKSGGYGVKYRVRSDYDLKAAIHAKGDSYRSFAGDDWDSSHLTSVVHGSGIRHATGERITEQLGVPFDTVFEVIQENAALAPNTVKGAQSALNTIFVAAVKAEIMTANPLANVDMPKVGEIDRPALTTEQARVFLANLSNIEHTGGVRAILITELFTGARTGELRALTWSDLNLYLVDAMGEYGLVNISKSVDGKNRVTPPKTKSSVRIIKIDGVLLFFLRQYRQTQAEQIAALGSRWTDNNLVFPSLTGEYMSANLPTKTVKRCIKDTDIDPKLHAHSMRHSFASILIDSGANVKAVQDALGHSSSRMTLDTYTHSFAEARAKATAAVSLSITGGENLLVTEKQMH